MTKRFLITVGLMGALSVILGSFGAHILSGNIPEKDLHLFNVANDYLMFHTLALLGLAFMNRYVSRSYLNIIYYLFVIGVILFSGTIFISKNFSSTFLMNTPMKPEIFSVRTLLPCTGQSMST